VKKHLIVAVACVGTLFAGVATSAAEQSDAAKDAKALCVQQKQADKAAFEAVWGDNALRDCKRAARGEVAEAAKNSAQECRAEEEADPAAFQETYGTNGNKKNAFGKCVSQKAREEQRERRAAKREAQKDCRAERKDIGREAFAEKYGTNRNNRNAFGKCVSKKAKAEKRKMDRADRAARVKQRNAAKECDEERGETSTTRAAFATKYGTNANDKNAFGKCVSQKAKA
jgi:hypothetical protein